MGQGRRKYEEEYTVQAVKLAKEIGAGKAAKELGIPVDTLYGWQKAVREGWLGAGPGSHTPETAMSLAEAMRAIHEEDLLKRDFQADKPLGKCVAGITEIKAKDGKLYVSAMLDCFDLTVLGLATDTNMRAQLCVRTLRGAAASRPA